MSRCTAIERRNLDATWPEPFQEIFFPRKRVKEHCSIHGGEERVFKDRSTLEKFKSIQGVIVIVGFVRRNEITLGGAIKV